MDHLARHRDWLREFSKTGRSLVASESHTFRVFSRTSLAEANAAAVRATTGFRGVAWFLAVAAKMTTANVPPLVEIARQAPVDNVLAPNESAERKRASAGALPRAEPPHPRLLAR